MSLDAIDKIPRASEEVHQALMGIAMPYEVGCGILSNLRAIDKLVEDVKNEQVREVLALREIIEGLLANWPHTEIADYYMPRGSRAVFTKQEALKRASETVS